MTPQQAAEKWGISRRSVRRYLECGRIEGVCVINGRTLIPADAQKPDDMRCRKNKFGTASVAVDPFVLTTSAFKPGTAEEFLDGHDDVTKRTVGRAELAYLRCEPDEAVGFCKELGGADSMETRLGGLLIELLASLFKDKNCSPINNFRDLQTIAKIAAEHPRYKKTGELFGLYLNITVHNRADIVFPETGVDTFSMPDGLKPMAVYAYARMLILEGSIGRAVGLAEGALIFMKDIYPVAAIYLALTVADGYVLSGRRDKAEYYFRYARSLAAPDGILAPFAEFRYMLAGLTEKCMRDEEPETYKRILDMSTVYMRNWITIHNMLTGETVSSKLSPTEFSVAMLASRGVANTEIAECMNISVNSVRTHMRNIFNKLGVYSRKELADFVIR